MPACWLEAITRPTMEVWKDLVSEKAKAKSSKPPEEAREEGPGRGEVSLQLGKPRRALGGRAV